jgi:hypothetical protein
VTFSENWPVAAPLLVLGFFQTAVEEVQDVFGPDRSGPTNNFDGKPNVRDECKFIPLRKAIS